MGKNNQTAESITDRWTHRIDHESITKRLLCLFKVPLLKKSSGHFSITLSKMPESIRKLCHLWVMFSDSVVVSVCSTHTNVRVQCLEGRTTSGLLCEFITGKVDSSEEQGTLRVTLITVVNL